MPPSKEKFTGYSVREKSERRGRGPTKKERILTLFTSGVTDLEELADLVETKSSYVASVLQEAGLISGYFDLYTSSAHLMNVHSKYISGKLGFKDEETARRSLDLLDAKYADFESRNDRAGQHHVLMAALTLFNRARWGRKEKEAEYFRRWLLAKLEPAPVHVDIESESYPHH